MRGLETASCQLCGEEMPADPGAMLSHLVTYHRDEFLRSQSVQNFLSGICTEAEKLGELLARKLRGEL